MRTRMTIAAVAAAVSLAAFAAAGAGAAPLNLHQGLVLIENGEPVPRGGLVENEQLVIDGYCHNDSPGKLLNNDAPIDLVQVEAPSYTTCEQGSVSGGIALVALSDNGTALMWSTLALTTPDKCVYDFPVLQGEFLIGAPYGKTYIQGEMVGVRSPFGGKSSCARTLRTEYAIADLGADGDMLQTELSSSPKF